MKGSTFSRLAVIEQKFRKMAASDAIEEFHKAKPRESPRSPPEQFYEFAE